MLECAVFLPYLELVFCIAKHPDVAIHGVSANILQVHLTFLKRIEGRRTKMRI
jgi:hypothetical protein